jgi:uncharacterized protein with beta-barrel porin domain
LVLDQIELRNICNAIVGSARDPNTTDIANNALNAVTPDQITGQQTNAIEIGGLQFRNVASRVSALRAGARGINVAGLGFNIDGKQISGAAVQKMLEGIVGGVAGEAGGLLESSRLGIFVNGNISFGEKTETILETGFDFDTYGITAGFDYRINDNLFAGVALGYGSSETDFDADGGGLDTDGYSASAFGSYYKGRLYIDGIASYGESDHDSKRRIAFGIGNITVNETALGSTEGDQTSFGVQSGMNFERDGFTFTPNVSMLHSDVSIDGFDEVDAGGLNYSFDNQGVQSFTLSAGLKANYAYSTNWGVLLPEFRADYVRELEDDPQAINVRFLNDPFTDNPASAQITVTTDAPDKDYFLIGLGVSAQFQNGFSGFIDWQTLEGYDDLKVDTFVFGARWEASF